MGPPGKGVFPPSGLLPGEVTASREEASGQQARRPQSDSSTNPVSAPPVPRSQIPNPAKQAQPQPQTHRDAPQADGHQSSQGMSEPPPQRRGEPLLPPRTQCYKNGFVVGGLEANAEDPVWKESRRLIG